MAKSVFISSTSKDLLEHRAAVDKAIRRLEMRPINMEDFGSQPGGASGVSVREVGKADIFVGIIARRYGYIPEGMDKAVTEQEYDEAVRRKLPRLMYLLHPDYDWPEDRIEQDETAQAKLAAFQARIEKNEVRSLFRTPEDLAAQVTADLTKLDNKQRRQQLVMRLITAALIVFALIAFVLAATPGVLTDVLVGLNVITETYTPSAPPTPTNTSTPTSTPTITPTPLEGAPFAEDEVGVVLANFTMIDPNAPRAERGGWNAILTRRKFNMCGCITN